MIVEHPLDIDRELAADALVLVCQLSGWQYRAVEVELLGERIVHRVVLLHVHRILDYEFLCHSQHAAQIEGADARWVIQQM